MTDKIACEGCGQKQSKNNAGPRVRAALAVRGELWTPVPVESFSCACPQSAPP